MAGPKPPLPSPRFSAIYRAEREAEPTTGFPFQGPPSGDDATAAGRPEEAIEEKIEEREGFYESTERISYLVVWRLNTVKRRPVENPSHFWLARPLHLDA
jgi:hypothetical protein